MPIVFTDDRKAAFEAVLPALSNFKRVFGRDVTPGFLAELYAARRYNLTLLDSVNALGADATDAQGRRYQIKHRSSGVLNVDINDFHFDYIVLVNMDAEDGQIFGAIQASNLLCLTRRTHPDVMRFFPSSDGRSPSNEMSRGVYRLPAQSVVGTIPRVATALSPIILWRSEQHRRVGQSGVCGT